MEIPTIELAQAIIAFCTIVITLTTCRTQDLPTILSPIGQDTKAICTTTIIRIIVFRITEIVIVRLITSTTARTITICINWLKFTI